jgi:hypothetical protein
MRFLVPDNNGKTYDRANFQRQAVTSRNVLLLYNKRRG